jgi:septal ring factor EnvC (AmiA/AmiB activator)
LSIDQITRVTATLIAYVSSDVALERWLNVEAERVVSIAQRLRKKFTGTVEEEMAIAQDALVAGQEDLEYVKGKASNMSQEIIAAEAAARADQIGLMETQQENEKLQLEIEQQLTSNSGQMLTTQQENDHLRLENDRLRGIVEEL